MIDVRADIDGVVPPAATAAGASRSCGVPTRRRRAFSVAVRVRVAPWASCSPATMESRGRVGASLASASLRPMSWLPGDFVHPVHLPLPDGVHHLRPIREADAAIDYPAVMGSRERLWGIFGPAWGWPPETMTYEEDRVDLLRHKREIAAHQSFSYALLAQGESAVLGCVYIDPPERVGADAEVCWWVVDDLVGSGAGWRRRWTRSWRSGSLSTGRSSSSVMWGVTSPGRTGSPCRSPLEVVWSALGVRCGVRPAGCVACGPGSALPGACAGRSVPDCF